MKILSIDVVMGFEFLTSGACFARTLIPGRAGVRLKLYIIPVWYGLTRDVRLEFQRRFQ